MSPIHVTLSIILQTGNATGLPSASQLANQVAQGFLGPMLGYMEAAMGIAFVVVIMMIIYNFVEYWMHPTSFGRSGAISEIFSHGRRLIFGAFGLWLALYIILFILQLGGAHINPAQTAWAIFQDEFKMIGNILQTAIQHAATP